MTHDEYNGIRILGAAGLHVGRLGVSGGYGALAEAFEEAFERGCNYFYHGSMRKPGMREAIRNLCAAGKRDELVLVLQSYSRVARLIPWSVERALKDLGTDRAEILLLGWHNHEPANKYFEIGERLKERGLVRHLAVSGHNRVQLAEMAQTGKLGAIHIRYNAAHRGAETEFFPKLSESVEQRPGAVVFTATRWGQLLDPKKMPEGEETPRGSDAYRFVLTHPAVDVCMSGPKNLEQMREALNALERGPMNEEELAWMRRIGDHLHDKGGIFG